MGQPVAFLEVISLDHERAHARFCRECQEAAILVAVAATAAMSSSMIWETPGANGVSAMA